jgi:hypothetical protein
VNKKNTHNASSRRGRAVVHRRRKGDRAPLCRGAHEQPVRGCDRTRRRRQGSNRSRSSGGTARERIRPRWVCRSRSGLRPSGVGFGRPVKEDDHARHAPTTVYAAMSASPARPVNLPAWTCDDIRARRRCRALPPRRAGYHLVSASSLAAVPPRMLTRSSSVRPGVSRMSSTAVRVHGYG